ncbi:hypothetical protein B0T17DRAFT_242582 [Bombardia bombarda]|uniref:FAD-binding PCMH-type domain-containing protein n=1 Tax=Bombardia bombarda TaxID=252184 RepID=A0AA40CBE6_9PEZI|nr:hypothetical protein B0T17DRAFT_242582 [Bombardia bombarda]
MSNISDHDFAQHILDLQNGYLNYLPAFQILPQLSSSQTAFQMATLLPTSPCLEAKCLIDARLQSQILIPTDADYKTRNDLYWSNSAKLQPAYIVRPRSANEVTTAVKALVSAGQAFAVRSGGHTNWAGSNNIDGGVTIDLGLLNATVFDAESETASIGPGAR